MLIALHKNATTTPATRLAIQQASGSDYELAERFNVGRSTIRKWRQRHGVQDASHTPHRLQTTLNAGQEELVVYLRSQLRLPLDDLLAVIHEFIEPAMSRSALARLQLSSSRQANWTMSSVIGTSRPWASMMLPPSD